jgi:hypothetical protein
MSAVLVEHNPPFPHIAKGRRQRAEGFYVDYEYGVVSAIKSVLTFMATAILDSCLSPERFSVAYSKGKGHDMSCPYKTLDSHQLKFAIYDRCR